MRELSAIAYSAGGENFSGYLADGSKGGRAPSVLIAHEGAGLNQHIKDCAARLAELGYVAFALDMFGAARPSMDDARAVVRRLRADPGLLRARALAALDLLKSHPHADADRMAAIGFCFGGKAVLELARAGAPLRAVVGFHAELTAHAPDDARSIRAKILVCQGADDPVIGADQRDAFVKEMTAAKVDWRMHLYGGVGHSFTNPSIDAYGFPGFAYDAAADRRSWRAMTALLRESCDG